MYDLRQAEVLLSASFPSGERGELFKPCDPSGIADAISAFARAILSNNGRLTLWGHPTTTPLVLMISRELRIKDSITVFQSAWFKETEMPEIDDMRNEQLGCVEWTPGEENLEKALQTMREAMICRWQYASALFFGGMEGIKTEYEMVKALSPETPCVPIAGPGGAAACLPLDDCARVGLSSLESSRGYPFMALQFVEALATKASVNR